MESKQELKVNPQEIKHIYKKQIQSFKDELKIHCGQYQIDLVEVDINEGFHQVMMNYLLKRQKLF